MKISEKLKRRVDTWSRNWNQPYSFLTKVQMAVRNNTIKLVRRDTCCGNHGEPGC